MRGNDLRGFMKTAWKYTIDGLSKTIEMPVCAEVLSVAFQGDDLCLWVMVDSKYPIGPSRTFEAFGTGHEIPVLMGVDYNFVGTAHADSGLVFHVFEVLY